jgi:hypothetical protein
MKRISAIFVATLAAVILWWLARQDDSRGTIAEGLVVPNVRLSGILASETSAASAMASTKLDIVNQGAPRKLRFVGVSCGPCMSVYTNDRQLSAGDTHELGQGQTWPLRVDIHTAGIFGERFQALYLREESSQGAYDRVARIEYRIYPDVHIQPDVITHQFEPQGAQCIEKQMVVRWARRGRDSGIPQLANGLGNFSIIHCTKASDDEEMEAGLWRSSWNVRLGVDRGSDDSISGVARPVKMRIVKETDVCAGEATLKTLIYTGCGIIVPNSVVLRPNQDGGAERAILLRSEDDHKFRILDAKCNSDAFIVGAATAAANYANSLTVSYRALSSDRVVAELSITTDHPRRPIVTLALIGEAPR